MLLFNQWKDEQLFLQLCVCSETLLYLHYQRLLPYQWTIIFITLYEILAVRNFSIKASLCFFRLWIRISKPLSVNSFFKTCKSTCYNATQTFTYSQTTHTQTIDRLPENLIVYGATQGHPLHKSNHLKQAIQSTQVTNFRSVTHGVQ